MKIIAYTRRDEYASAIVELSQYEFRLLTGGDLYRFQNGSEVKFVPLIERAQAAVQVSERLNKSAEALRGMAAVLDHIDALVPEAPTPE